METQSEITERLLDGKQAAKILNVKPETLEAWRVRRTGDLRYVRVGRLVRYPASEVRAFIERNTVSNAR